MAICGRGLMRPRPPFSAKLVLGAAALPINGNLWAWFEAPPPFAPSGSCSEPPLCPYMAICGRGLRRPRPSSLPSVLPGAAAIFPPPPLSPLRSPLMALVSADSRIAELLGELHQLIKQTQVPGFGGFWGRGGPPGFV